MTPSPSGYGWTSDGMYPFFPGTPCVHCGRFVGRDGIFNVEYWEMSNEIASMDAEHRDCPREEGKPECIPEGIDRRARRITAVVAEPVHDRRPWKTGA